MSYRLDCRTGDRHLHVSMQGEWPRRAVAGLLTELIELWERHGRKPVLLDLRRVTDAPSVADDYGYARDFAEGGFLQLGRVAFLDVESRRDANEFFATASANRGLSFRFFYDGEREAVDWLLGCNDA